MMLSFSSKTLRPWSWKAHPNDTSTAVTIVGSTPAFGIGAFRAQDNQTNEDDALYAAEPPKKRQRSAAAVILGAAVETVIFTSAVALSAYQLLTGKGRQQLDATMSSPTAESAKATPAAPQGNGEPVFEKSVVQMKSAPVDIPTRTIQRRDSSSGVLGKSLHHNTHRHKSRNYKHSSYKSPRGHGLSISLPHAYDNDYLSKDSLPMPERPKQAQKTTTSNFSGWKPN
ncbi:hypothetical protein BCR41DRAFT_107728 [Lobosporangium transversale]|uniref:Uncharacterized protein n=1 Tax=Lobosporangium transversale TaxID=64571 RepID=A0A1Y2GJS1_9FUNG|nr:hypothetical protein BCR41DRAFT_115385 [Lobosporangium transversale]XP_021879792.1 hypothetical protein BCR41DRAFT_107728 [Lobosporangium transversale]ORZ11000.1 hypothetical protein BCR41DRAFT_115385 [Lobosporangium transversale]ORZ11695.1 hypothetical protein BCR41DRAFT_107728 [Lobosporangium transversale]|eukprot:XP_021879517.1 hypothetical protein BCR41DRAFT_115385 [Lobosporangium transversale]